jgi:dihydrofolate synthase/folylpolyglutamate synthase
VLEARAAQLRIPVTRAQEFPLRDVVLDERGATFSGLRCPLAGEHQLDNALTAAQALIALGLPPEGIAGARWPGRLEHVAPNPDTILDGAHNPAGARALANYLRRFYSTRKRWIIFGAMRDKDVREVAETLFPLADELVLTAPTAPGNRALEPEALLAMAGRGHTAPTIAAAYEYVLQHVTAEDVIIITGSLYLVGEARQLFLKTTLGRW